MTLRAAVAAAGDLPSLANASDLATSSMPPDAPNNGKDLISSMRSKTQQGIPQLALARAYHSRP